MHCLKKFEDEIILCLNYDGLYGINNINRFLQCSNQGKAVTWGVSTYKVGDPILFSETERFKPVIYNNLKGKIIDIIEITGGIQFEVELDRSLDESSVWGTELVWIRDSIVSFLFSIHFLVTKMMILRILLFPSKWLMLFLSIKPKDSNMIQSRW